MTEWDQVPESVIELAGSLIDQYHPSLKAARIGFLFRSPVSKSQGREVWGQAEKVTAKWQALLPEPLDFIIWLAADIWLDVLDDRQRKALLDHELCHCFWDGEKAHIHGHDIEEFTVIIERHGLWNSAAERMAQATSAYQAPLIGERGGVFRVNPGGMKGGFDE